jgi:O-antigen/teichoic acid export membrane protein
MSQKSNENSYKSILKGTSLFGGVQIFQILVSLVRGKFVAMFLGPDGMGVASLFTTSSNTIGQVSTLGLNLAFTREIADNKENPSRLAVIRKVAVRLAAITALLGALATALLAPWLSQITFGSSDYTWQFMLMSIMIWLTVAGGGKMALIQGVHKVKILSTVSVIGAAVGLLAGVPLYYFFGTKGIVPAMIILSLSTYISYSVGLRKAIPHSADTLHWKEQFPLVKRLLAVGLVMVTTTLLSSLATYLLNIYLRSYGNLDTVGLYNAANSITNQYSSVVFAAMSLDYFPRLSAISNDTSKMNGVVNRQMEVVSLMAAPIITLIIACSPTIIMVLLTDQFESIIELVRWMALGITLKALSFPLGYITFAKDNRRMFLWLEGIVCNVLYLGLGIAGYHFFGLIGMGYAMVVENLACIIIYYIVNRHLYGFKFNRGAWKSMLAAVALCALCFVASLIELKALSYWLMTVAIVIALVWAYLRLRVMLSRQD